MFIPRTLALGLAACSLGAVTLNADTLIMQDGRRIRGDLVSVSRGVVLFNQEATGTRRIVRVRVPLADVRRINLMDDNDVADDTYGNGANGRYGSDRLGSDRNGTDRGTDRYGSDRGYDAGRRERMVTVSGRDAWTNTSIDVQVGDTISFVTEGTINWGPGRKDTAAGEPNSPYNQARPVANRPAGALIGRIGNDTFFIGAEEGAFRARTSGRLYLGVNDDYLSDNSGAFSVRVLY